MLYSFKKNSQNGVLKLKLKHHGGGSIYSHSIIYGQKKLDNIGVCRPTECVNNVSVLKNKCEM